MIPRAIGFATFSVLTLLLAGCGTMGGMGPPDMPKKAVLYSGVRGEYAFAKHILTDDADKIEHGKVQYAPLIVFHSAMLCVGLPVSAISDTLTIPLVLQAQKREAEAAEIRRRKLAKDPFLTEEELNPAHAPKASRP